MDILDILDRLVGFPSVVGRPNADIVGWIADYARRCGARVVHLPGPEGDRANLLISVGPAAARGYVLSGHMDVVPAEEPGWLADPFRLRREAGRLIGRGSTDMKGFLAAALSCLPALAARPLVAPIHLAFSYDEEAGCRGVPHLIARLPELIAPPLGVIVGEPSGMRAILAHKGKAAARAVVTGKSGHSSRPDLALNAIHGLSRVLATAVATAQALEADAQDATFAPPWSTLQVGVIGGGQAVNVIPDQASLSLEARAIWGVDPGTLLAPVRTALEALAAEGYGVAWQPLSAYPPLRLPPEAPLAALLARLTGAPPLGAVSYGTEAGLYQAAGHDAIICGPGDIGRAHKPEEFITEAELEACRGMILRLAETC